MKFNPHRRLIPHVCIIVVIGVALYLTRDWPYETALFPRAGCTMVLSVAILAFVSELVRGQRRRAEQEDTWLKSKGAGEGIFLRAVAVFGWLIAFLIGVWALGYELAAIAFVLLFMKVKGKQSWRLSVFFSAVCFAFLVLVFRLGLNVTWPHAALWRMFGL